jgi:hypothetical protein
MRGEFKGSRKWKRLGGIVATSTAGKVAEAGFVVFEVPTHTLPNHGRIIHPDGIEGFTEDNLARLCEAFTKTEEFE